VDRLDNLFSRLMFLNLRRDGYLHELCLMLIHSVAVVQKDAAEAFVFVAKDLFEFGLTVKCTAH